MGNLLFILVLISTTVEESSRDDRRMNLLVPSFQTATTLKETDRHLKASQSRDVDLNDLVSRGFLFIDGQYVNEASELSLTDRGLYVGNSVGSMFASISNVSEFGVSDAISDVISPASHTISLSDDQRARFFSTLSNGGVVHLSSDGNSFFAESTAGGDEVLEALLLPKEERASRVGDIADRRAEPLTAKSIEWLSTVTTDSELVARATDTINRFNEVESTNTLAASSVRRLNNWSFPLTIVAMGMFVFSIGTLVSVRPQELAAVSHQPNEVSVHRLLGLILAMSVVDLVWTLLAHQANQIAEVNPVGNVLLGSPVRVIGFKLMATALAVGILFRARGHEIARKATWWICLTLALLMARWVLVSGVSV